MNTDTQNEIKYWEATTIQFAPVSTELARELMDAYLVWRRKRNKPAFIVAGAKLWRVDHESQSKNAFFASRSNSFYFVSEDNKLIRVSDHWSATGAEYSRSSKFNCGMIRTCYWTNMNGQAFDYCLPGERYSSRLIAGITDLNKL